MQKSLVPVVSEFVPRPLETSCAFALGIFEPRLLSSMMSFLTSRFMLNDIGLYHLKQVKLIKSTTDTKERKVCILCLMPENTTIDDFIQQLDETNNIHKSVLDFLIHFKLLDQTRTRLFREDLQLEIARIPSFAPESQEQWLEFNSHWPLKQAKVAQPVVEEKLTEEEIQKAETYMKMAWEEALNAKKRYSNVVGVGAIIVRVGVDGDEDVVMARTFDHSLPTMSPYDYERNNTGTETLTDTHPLGHATMQCVQQVASRDMMVFTKREEGRLEVAQETDLSKVPYVCTGCDLYITHEPCCMCAMALVHSRIRRVFYSVPTPSFGGLSSTRIHEEKSLNHHYKVFTWK